MTLVSFQGEHGAYSEGAALEFFPDAKTVPHATFADAVNAAESAQTEYAVLPIENSLEGSVSASYDILRTTNMRIAAETYYQIAHCLIGRGTLDQVKTVYSHPQALGQCRNFIESHHFKTVPTYDTAGSVPMISQMGNDAACIASMHAARLHDMPVIQTPISDRNENHTRFVLLAKPDTIGAAQGVKTSIIASLKHETGTLYALLGVFSDQKINLTRIESRPKREGAWEYDFFIDLECDAVRAGEVIDAASKLPVAIKTLGSYSSVHSG